LVDDTAYDDTMILHVAIMAFDEICSIGVRRHIVYLQHLRSM
jgi:hypothetical protein